MQVPFLQNTKSGCGSYSLANLFNNIKFIEGIENQSRGENVADLNKQLSTIYSDLYIEPYFHTNTHLKHYPRLTDIALFDLYWDKVTEENKKNQARPFLFTIKSKSEKFHCILVVHNLEDNLFYIVDSLAPEIIKMPIQELINQYYIVAVNIFCLWDAPDEERDIFIFKKHFSHLFEN